MEHKEAGCQAPLEAPKLCANNCGFFGSAATLNLCSKCHKDFIMKQEQAKLAVSSIESIVNGGPSDHGKKPVVAAAAIKVESEPAEISIVTALASCTPLNGSGVEKVKDSPNRCNACRKRVGLTGFNCRCGSLFCAVHRYSDKHNCNFDYQAVGREAIAKANPVVKAEKLDKI